MENSKKQTILIIDDNPDFASMVDLTLRCNGFKTIKAIGGPTGLKVWDFHRQDINLVIVDVLMPEIDGYGVMREIKKIDPDCKIIAMSGTEPRLEVMTRDRCGSGIFLAKPFKSEDLVAAVNSLLN